MGITLLEYIENRLEVLDTELNEAYDLISYSFEKDVPEAMNRAGKAISEKRVLLGIRHDVLKVDIEGVM